jgi:multidrug efflux pump subunit AcrB
MEAVSIERGRAYTTINRRNGRRVVTVTADARPRSKAGQVVQSLREETLPELQDQYPGLTYSFEGPAGRSPGEHAEPGEGA